MHSDLEILSKVVPALATALGKNYEVVLHDFSDLAHSIIAIGGSLTGRRRGGAVTDVVLAALKQEEVTDLISYPATLGDGRRLKSSTIFLKDAQGSPIGCLCINFDCTVLQETERVIRELIETHVNSIPCLDENFTNDITQLASAMIHKAVCSIAKPVPHMTAEDKARVVEMLDNQGLFMVKGGVEATAQALSISRATFYAYQEKLRGRKLSGRGVVSSAHSSTN